MNAKDKSRKRDGARRCETIIFSTLCKLKTTKGRRKENEKEKSKRQGKREKMCTKR